MTHPKCLPRPHRGAERGGLGERWTAWCNRPDEPYPPAGLLAEMHGVVPVRTEDDVREPDDPPCHPPADDGRITA